MIHNVCHATPYEDIQSCTVAPIAPTGCVYYQTMWQWVILLVIGPGSVTDFK